MSEAFDVEARRDAWEDLRPIAQGGNGVAVTISRKSAGTATRDPTTGVRTVVPPANDNGCGMLESYRAHMTPSSRVLSTDKRLWLAALDVTGATPLAQPLPGDVVTIGSVTYQVVEVEPYEPAGMWVWAYVWLRG